MYIEKKKGSFLPWTQLEVLKHPKHPLDRPLDWQTDIWTDGRVGGKAGRHRVTVDSGQILSLESKSAGLFISRNLVISPCKGTYIHGCYTDSHFQ